MAKSYDLTMAGHPNIYDDSERELPIWFCEPEAGVNSNTGILLLTSGFGESVTSDECVQARQRLADEHNFVTVQCEYFGNRFMGTQLNPSFTFKKAALQQVFTPDEWQQIDEGDSLNMTKLLEYGVNYPIHLEGVNQLGESLQEFNDMGMMQALDNVAAVLTVMAILDDNELPYDRSRIVAYGHGHGAYIQHLCNAMAPRLFAAQVDYHSWLFPDYLALPRVLHYQRGRMKQSILFDYLARKQPIDQELLRLPSLYRRFQNQSRLICFEDRNTDEELRIAKKSFCHQVPNATYIECGGIQEAAKYVDNDYYTMFDYAMNMLKLDARESASGELMNTQVHTAMYRYDITYNLGLPQLTRSSKSRA